MSSIITEYLRSCPDCQNRKTTNHHAKSPITAYKTPCALFEGWQDDLVDHCQYHHKDSAMLLALLKSLASIKIKSP